MPTPPPPGTDGGPHEGMPGRAHRLADPESSPLCARILRNAAARFGVHPVSFSYLTNRIMHTQNQSLLAALYACISACEHCATACLGEADVKMMVRCIALDRDCADICALTARLIARGSEHGQHLLRECAEICKLCGDECEKHAAHIDHCRACAAACRAGMKVAA